MLKPIHIVQICVSDLDCPEVSMLLAELDAYLLAQYPNHDVQRSQVTAVDFQHENSGFWVAYASDGQAVGCVALRPLAAAVAELKRLYVQPQWWGQGIGRKLMQTVEAAAIAWEYQKIKLETGDRQPESIRLYQRLGYEAVACFGRYIDDPHSRCFEKRLR